jgi:hypothetical protein
MEISGFRCCLCPNINKPRERICPPGGPAQKPQTLCRFVLTFLDKHGRILKVKKIPSGKLYDEAQQELNAQAIKEGWSIYE